MKDQGLKPNFQDSIQPQLLEKSVLWEGEQKYFYKSYELMMMLNSSSQVDESSDLRNVDI